MFIAAREKQETILAEHCIVDPIARPPIDPEFAHTIAKRFAVTKVSQSDAVNPNCDLGLCSGIFQLSQPLPEYIPSRGSDIAENFKHGLSVTYKLQTREQTQKVRSGFA